MIPTFHRLSISHSPDAPSGSDDGNNDSDQLETSSRMACTTLTYNPRIFSPGLDGFTDTFGSMNTPLPYSSDGSSTPSFCHTPGMPNKFNLSPRNVADNQMMNNSV